MICESVLVVVVSSDLLIPPPKTNLEFPRLFQLLRLVPKELLVESSSEDLEGCRTILNLWSMALRVDGDAGGEVCDADGWLGRVHMLTTGSRRTLRLNLQVSWIYLNLDFRRRGKYGDGARGSVDTTCSLCFGYPLNPMNPTLVL
jgi:hypothetical protein